MSDPEPQLDNHEHQVTPLELFFDLVFVFAITQVTSLLSHDATWAGVLHGMLILVALWWAWTGYAWLTSTLDVDEGGVRLAMLAAMGAMLVAALAVPGAFADDAVLFGVAYLLVRLLHIVLYAIVGRDDPDLLAAVLRFAPTSIFGASLLVLAGFLEGDVRIVVWVVALAIDYVGPAVLGAGRGWRVAPEHFAERHGLVILIALGESIVAIGVGAGFELTTRVIIAAGLAIVVVSALWWLYFDVAAIFARTRLREATGVEQARLARDAYSYLHLPMVAGIVLFAFGLKTTLGHVGDELRQPRLLADRGLRSDPLSRASDAGPAPRARDLTPGSVSDVGRGAVLVGGDVKCGGVDGRSPAAHDHGSCSTSFRPAPSPCSLRRCCSATSSVLARCCATVSSRRVASGRWTDSSTGSSVSGPRTHARTTRAARLIGRADMLCEETASDLQQAEGRVRAETEAELRARLGEDGYAAVCAEGRALSLEDALALALRPD